MKLYRHYKDKDYRYLGVAKHSESLDEMVVYETRYPNDLGKLWVRPRKMFEEEVLVDGKKQARFAKISLQLSHQYGLSQSDLTLIKAMSDPFLQSPAEALWRDDLLAQKNLVLLRADIENQLVGFQIGRAENSNIFVTLLGAVRPDFQGLGIAHDMMHAEQVWCRAQGYKKISTKILSRMKAVLSLALQASFDIIGTDKNPEVGLQILLEKAL